MHQPTRILLFAAALALVACSGSTEVSSPTATTVSPSPTVSVSVSPSESESGPTPSADPDDPASYYTTDGTSPALFPDCPGVLGLCLGNPVERAIALLGIEDERYQGVKPGLIDRAWSFDGIWLTVVAPEVGAIQQMTVSVMFTDAGPGLRIALPRGLVMGTLLMGEVVHKLGSPTSTDSSSVEDLWFYSYKYKTGPEGTVTLEFVHTSEGREVSPGAELNRSQVTAFTVGYGDFD